MVHVHLTKNKIHPHSCEIEDFKVLIVASCVQYSDHAYCWVCVLVEDIGRRLPLILHSVACPRANRVMLSSLCAESIKPVSEGDKI